MEKIKLILEDQFSGCSFTKNLEVCEDKVIQLERIFLEGSIITQFDKKQQIRYNWKIINIIYFNLN